MLINLPLISSKSSQEKERTLWWLRIHLPMQGMKVQSLTQVQSLIGELRSPTGLGAAKPELHNERAHVLQIRPGTAT